MNSIKSISFGIRLPAPLAAELDATVAAQREKRRCRNDFIVAAIIKYLQSDDQATA